MLQHAANGRKAFEFALYNRDVRAAVKDNQGHQFIGEQWADIQICDVMAADEREARRLIQSRYPPEMGFVVEGLVSRRH